MSNMPNNNNMPNETDGGAETTHQHAGPHSLASRAVSVVSEAAGRPARLESIETIECPPWREDLTPIETGIANYAKPIYISLQGKAHRLSVGLDVAWYTHGVQVLPAPEGKTGMIVKLVPEMTSAKHLLDKIKACKDQIFDGPVLDRPVFLFPPKWVTATRVDERIGVEVVMLHFSQATYDFVASYEAAGTYPMFVVTQSEFFDSDTVSAFVSDEPPVPYGHETGRPAAMAMTWETFKSKGAVMPEATVESKKRPREDADGCGQPAAKRADK